MGLQERSFGIGLLVPESISKTFGPITKLPTLKRRNKKRKKNNVLCLARTYRVYCLKRTDIDNYPLRERREETAQGPKQLCSVKWKQRDPR